MGSMDEGSLSDSSDSSDYGIERPAVGPHTGGWSRPGAAPTPKAAHPGRPSSGGARSGGVGGGGGGGPRSSGGGGGMVQQSEMASEGAHLNSVYRCACACVWLCSVHMCVP